MRTALFTALALGTGLLASPATAQPTALTEAQMDGVTAGDTRVSRNVTNTRTNTNRAATATSVTGIPDSPPVTDTATATNTAVTRDIDIVEVDVVEVDTTVP